MAANNNTTTTTTTTNVIDDNTSRYQCFVEMHPPGTLNPRHFQVPATIHPFHGPIVELALFHLWLSDTEDRPMDFFRGPRTCHRVDIYWDPPLGEFICYHQNEVLYFDYSVITPEDGDSPDLHPDRTHDSSDNHSTPSPTPLCVNSTSSHSPSPVTPTKVYTSTSPSLRSSERATYHHRRDPYSYLWKLVAYSGGLKANVQLQRRQRQEKLKELKGQEQQVPLAVFMYGDESSQRQQQQHQSQQYQSPQKHSSQSQSHSPQQQQQSLNRDPVLVHSFTHYGQRPIHRRQDNHHHRHHQSEGYINHALTTNHSQDHNNQNSQAYNHPSQAQNHRQSQDYNQGQYYNQTQTCTAYNHNHGHGHNQPQNYTNLAQPNNYTQTYNSQAPTNNLRQETKYAQTFNQLHRFNYQSSAGERLAREHLEDCRWSAVKFETYLNDLHSKVDGRPLTVSHPPLTTVVANQGYDSPLTGDDGRSHGQGKGGSETEQEEKEEELVSKKKNEEKEKKAETEREAEMEMEMDDDEENEQEKEGKEEEEALARRGPQALLKRKQSSYASNKENKEDDKVEIKQETVSDDDRAVLQRELQKSSEKTQSSESEAEKTENNAKRFKKNTNDTSRGRIRENPPATSFVEPVAKRTRSRCSVFSTTRVPPSSSTKHSHR